MPGLLSDRLFYIFDENRDGYICITEFMNSMITIFTGNFEKLIHFVFKIYDSDNDGEISKEDVKLILSYIPLKEEGYHSKVKFRFENETYFDRIESHEEINKFVKILFGNDETIDELDFKRIVTEKSSEAFVYVKLYLILRF